MIIEAKSRLKINFPGGGSIRLEPGKPVFFPETQGLRLLQKAPEDIKVLSFPTEPVVGQTVTWDSPLFGLLSAVVLSASDQSVTVFHPLSEQEAVIPKRWLRPE
jgi:hypothetical protein